MAKSAKTAQLEALLGAGFAPPPIPDWFERADDNYRVWGPGFLYGAALEAGGDPLLYCRILSSAPRTYHVLERWLPDGRPVFTPSEFLPGHLISGQYGQAGQMTTVVGYGPRPAPVMVIGKFPWLDELQYLQNFVGASGREWKSCCARCGVSVDGWYVTNLIKVKPPDHKKIPESMIKEFMALLYYEISVVQPKIIVTMGTHAFQAVCGRKYKFSDYRGASLEWCWPRYGINARVLPTIIPSKVLADPAMRPGFESDMARLCRLVRGEESNAPLGGEKVNYVVVETLEQLDKLLDYLDGPQFLDMAVDCEWAGQHPSGDPSRNYLRSIQLCWGVGQAAYLRMSDENGQRYLAAHGKFVVGSRLKRLFHKPGLRLHGHWRRADIPWLEDLGLGGVALEDAVLRGFDTILAHHVLEEASEHDLNTLAARYTPLGRYDRTLRAWVAEHGGDKHLEEHGYRYIPDKILTLYGLCDVDATYRLMLIFRQRLQDDHEDALRRNPPIRFDGLPATPLTLFETIEGPATLPILEMERNGIGVDVERMESLTAAYRGAYNSLLQRFREMIHWPNFNPKSIDHVRAYLFHGLQYAGAKLGVAPDGALVHCFRPVKATGRNGKAWERLTDDELRRASPSTDGDTLEILASDSGASDVNLLADIRTINQVLTSFLSEANEDGEFTRGLRQFVRPDHTIHTTLSQLAETGRYRSSDPNCQNWPKRQEKEFARILKAAGIPAQPPIRSCFRARPGWLLVEADYRQAELYTMAWFSRDQRMMEILSDQHRSLHYEAAVEIFELSGKYPLANYSDEVLEAFKKNEVLAYVSAKGVNFGIPYGLGPNGLSMNLRGEGVRMPPARAREIIEKHRQMFPALHHFLDEVVAGSVRDPGFFANTWGRRRHFAYTNDEQVLAGMEREAKNFPIQSEVADNLSLALYQLWRYKRVRGGCGYRLLLPVHDAVISEVRPAYLREYVEQVLPACMRVPMPALGIALDIDVEVGLRWGEKATVDELEAVGVERELAERFGKKLKAA